MTNRVACVLFAAVLGLGACASLNGGRSPGWQVPLGKATAMSYAEFDSRGAPTAIGVAMPAAALDGLPAGSDNHHCTDRGRDGSMGVQRNASTRSST